MLRADEGYYDQNQYIDWSVTGPGRDSVWLPFDVYVHTISYLLLAMAFTGLGLLWSVYRSRNASSPPKGVKRASSGGSSALSRYWASLRWFSIPASVGFTYVCYQQYFHIRKREQRKILSGDYVPDQWQAGLMRKMPTRAMSRMCGIACELHLPLWMRKPCLGLFAWYCSCNLYEAMEEDLSKYKSVGDFFRRELKPSARPINQTNSLVSPSDGCVLHFGVVEDGLLEQIKGITYCMKTFLGPNQPHSNLSDSQNGKRLYHCVIYLAPGDYHSFHSPTEWQVQLRRHFPGDLFSVKPGVARIMNGVFNYNERVVLSGKWKHGYFSLAAVGATNVGSIEVKFDEGLQTNRPGNFDPGSFYETGFMTDGSQGVSLVRGEKVGAFNLGSSIVLVFEAPKDFEFRIKPGQRVKYGEPLGCVGPS